jgi:XRE family aerobic/anaerobic benzoate catabolism transcriptional regulator
MWLFAKLRVVNYSASAISLQQYISWGLFQPMPRLAPATASTPSAIRLKRPGSGTRTPTLARASSGRVASAAPSIGDDVLAALGERVRDARARRGITRRQLAADSRVSERFLAHLEAGSGNVSVLKLKQIADALRISCAELFIENNGRAAELAALTQLLGNLPERTLAELRVRLLQQFGDTEPAGRRHIALIGLRGAGKSTLGAKLAKRLGIAFIELDREIEREAGTSLHEIFLLYGQGGYRRYERRCLENLICRDERAVIATGGSIVSEPATYDLLRSACFTVWLKATPEEHMTRVVEQGDFRPMAGNSEAMSDLRRILDAREPLYRGADVTVDTSGCSVQQSLANLQRLVKAP